MSYTEWKIANIGNNDIGELVKGGYSPLLAAVLCSRGFTTVAEADAFLRCGADYLNNPFLMADMDKAASRVRLAIERGEKVAVFGDYDVDGITSTCLLTDYLTFRGLACIPYIPSRIEEGYGLNCAAVESLANSGVSLIITVDCGVTAVEEAEFAKTLGVDMIITDHHECREVLPDALAVVNPKRHDCDYPSRDLAGVGVAFKLLCAIEGGYEEMIERYADLVAVGTVADVMPLVGENRYIIKKGIEKLQTSPREGLAALIAESGLGEKKISATGIGFTIAPRLNASGRLGQTELSEKLLLTNDPIEAKHYAEELCQLNRNRQALEQDIWEEAVAMLEGQTPDAPIVLARENWHQGVIGIAASRLTEAYNVPAIMIGLTEDMGKGSSRSFGGFNLFEALSACSEYLEGFGGHALAAGLTIKRENVDAFRNALAEYYRNNPCDTVSTLEIDACITSGEQLTMRCVEDLELMEPCGNANPRPQLCILRAMLDEVNPIGGGKHLKMKISKFQQTFEAVYFGCTAAQLGISAGSCVDIAFALQVNEFRGRRSVQLLVLDIREHNFEPARAILGGEIPETAEFAPSREDCVRVYRAVQTLGGAISGKLPRFLEAFPADMREETACICLKVFEELGLMEIRQAQGGITAQLIPTTEKFELESSQIYSKLNLLAKKAQTNG